MTDWLAKVHFFLAFSYKVFVVLVQYFFYIPIPKRFYCSIYIYIFFFITFVCLFIVYFYLGEKICEKPY